MKVEIIMENIKNIFYNEKNQFMNTNRKTYYMYKYSFIFLIVASIMLLLTSGIETFVNNIGIVTNIITPFILVAFFIDFYFIIRLLWDSVLGKILYSIIGYFAYIKATVHAKEIIYINTLVNPDVYQTSISYIAGWLLIPSWIYYINTIFGLIILFLGFAQILIPILVEPVKLLLAKLNSQIIDKLQEYFENKIHFHTIYFLLAVILINFIIIEPLVTNIYNFSNHNRVKQSIKENSYYLAGNVCDNKKIRYDDYIKLIGDNIVSIAKTDMTGDIKFYKDKCNN